MFQTGYRLQKQKCRQLIFDATMTRHLVSGSVMIFGSCHLILFVSSTNYFQIVRPKCCERSHSKMYNYIILTVLDDIDLLSHCFCFCMKSWRSIVLSQDSSLKSSLKKKLLPLKKSSNLFFWKYQRSQGSVLGQRNRGPPSRLVFFCEW